MANAMEDDAQERDFLIAAGGTIGTLQAENAALREENERLKQSVRLVLEGLRSGTHGNLCWCPEKHCPMATHLNCVHRQSCLATGELWKQMEREKVE